MKETSEKKADAVYSGKMPIDAFLPPYVTVPLMGGGCIVKKGDTVEEGQLLNGKSAANAHLPFIPVHSPVPGKVIGVLKLPLANGSRGYCVRILTGGAFTYLGKRHHAAASGAAAASHAGKTEGIPVIEASGALRAGKDKEKAESALDILREKGVLNTYDSIHSTKHPVLLADACKAAVASNKERQGADTIVVCLEDEDPSARTVSALSRALYKEIMEGARLVSEAVNARRVVFVGDESMRPLYETASAVLPASEGGKADGAGAAGEGGKAGGKKDDLHKSSGGCVCQFVASAFRRYPSALEPILKSRITNLPRGGVLFTDAAAMIAAREALLQAAPSMTTYVYVLGEGLRAQGLFKVRVGTSVRFLASTCGGLAEEHHAQGEHPAGGEGEEGYRSGGIQNKCDAVIINGLMVGSFASMDTPIDRYVRSVTFVPKGVLHSQAESECVMCGNCREVCPQGLLPDVLFANGDVFGARECTGCGLCNSVCPARLALVQNIMTLASAPCTDDSEGEADL